MEKSQVSSSVSRFPRPTYVSGVQKNTAVMRSLLTTAVEAERARLKKCPVELTVTSSVKGVPSGAKTEVDVAVTVTGPCYGGKPDRVPACVVLAVNCSERIDINRQTHHRNVAVDTLIDSLRDGDMIHVVCCGNAATRIGPASASVMDDVTGDIATLSESIKLTKGSGTAKTADVINYCSSAIALAKTAYGKTKSYSVIYITDGADLETGPTRIEHDAPLHVICLDEDAVDAQHFREYALGSGGSFHQIHTECSISTAVVNAFDTTDVVLAAKDIITKITTTVAANLRLQFRRTDCFNVGSIKIATNHRVFKNVFALDTTNPRDYQQVCADDTGLADDGFVFIPSVCAGEKHEMVFTVAGYSTCPSGAVGNFGDIVLVVDPVRPSPPSRGIYTAAAAYVSDFADDATTYNLRSLESSVLIKHRVMLARLRKLILARQLNTSAVEDVRAEVDTIREYVGNAIYAAIMDMFSEVTAAVADVTATAPDEQCATAL